jgi:hypothetical protein
MKIQKTIFGLCIQALAQVALITPSLAFDLVGAWTVDKSACPQVFTKNGASIAFGANSEMWGKGFIVEGNSIRGQSVKCAIKSKKEAKSSIHLIASCASDIMIDQVQMSFKITSDNSITRVFPGIGGLESPYVRCEF